MKELTNTILGVASNEKSEIEILIDNPSFFQKLRKKTVRKYTVNKYTTLDQNIKITQLLKEIPEFNFKQSDTEILIDSIDIVDKYTDSMVAIISIVLNEKDKKFLRTNLSNADMFKLVFEATFGMINFQDFTSTIASTRNSTSLETSPENK